MTKPNEFLPDGDPHRALKGPDPLKPRDKEKSSSFGPPQGAKIVAGTDATKDAVSALLDAVAARKQRKLATLQEKQESNEVAKDTVDLNRLFALMESPTPILTREELGNKALALTYEEFQELGVIEVRWHDGSIELLDPDDLHPQDVLVIYPDQLS